MPTCRLVRLLLLLYLTSLSRGASAQTSKTISSTAPLTFRFEGPPGCPTEQRAFAFIQRHSKVVRRASGSTAPVAELQIIVKNTASDFQGTLLVQRSSGPIERRTVQGSSCQEVVEALALTAALSVDPEATLLSENEGESQDRDSNRPRPDPENKEALDQTPTVSSTPTASRNRRAPLAWALGPRISVEGIFDHSTHLGIGADLSVRRPTSRIWFPFELSASFRYLFEGPFTGSDELSTELGVGRIAYCPLRLGSRLLVLACGGLDVGWVKAQGKNLEDSFKVRRSIAQVDFEFPLRYAPNSWEFWVAPGLGIGLTQRQFGVEPGPEILSQQRAVSWTMSTGVRVVF